MRAKLNFTRLLSANTASVFTKTGYEYRPLPEAHSARGDRVEALEGSSTPVGRTSPLVLRLAAIIGDIAPLLADENTVDFKPAEMFPCIVYGDSQAGGDVCH
jgi:hypothetical protein